MEHSTFFVNRGRRKPKALFFHPIQPPAAGFSFKMYRQFRAIFVALERVLFEALNDDVVVLFAVFLHGEAVHASPIGPFPGGPPSVDNGVTLVVKKKRVVTAFRRYHVGVKLIVRASLDGWVVVVQRDHDDGLIFWGGFDDLQEGRGPFAERSVRLRHLQHPGHVEEQGKAG